MKKMIILFIFLVLFTNCSPNPTKIPASPSTFPATNTSTTTPTVTASAIPTSTPSPTTTFTPTPTFTPQPTLQGGGVPMLAFNGKTGDQFHPYLVNLYQGEPVLIEAGWNKWGLNLPQWSHNRRYLVITNDDGLSSWSLYLFDRTTKVIKKLVTAEANNSFYGIEWSTDDQWLAFAFLPALGGFSLANLNTYSIADGKLYKISDRVISWKWRKDKNEVIYRSYDTEEWWKSDAQGKNKQTLEFQTIIPSDIYAPYVRGKVNYIAPGGVETCNLGFFSEVDGFLLNRKDPAKKDYRILFFPFEKGNSWSLPISYQDESSSFNNCARASFFNKGQWLYLRLRKGNLNDHYLIDVAKQNSYLVASPTEKELMYGLLGVSPDGRLVAYHNLVKQDDASQIVIQEISTGKRIQTWTFPKSITPRKAADDSHATFIGQLEWMPPGE